MPRIPSLAASQAEPFDERDHGQSIFGYDPTMNREHILHRLKASETDLRARGVSHAALFGSVARGEQRPDSDIDILVEIAPEAEMDLFAYLGIVHFLEDLFLAKVDVANRAQLKDLVRPSAERDAVYAF